MAANTTAAPAAPTQTPSPPPKGLVGEKGGAHDARRPTSAAGDTPNPSKAGTKSVTEVKSTAPHTGIANHDTPMNIVKTAYDNKQEKESSSSVGAVHVHVHDDDAEARKLRRRNILDMTADKTDRSIDGVIVSKRKADNKEVPEKQQRNNQRRENKHVPHQRDDRMHGFWNEVSYNASRKDISE